MPRGTNIINMTGLRVGRWTVQVRAERVGKKGQVYWHCRCECGVERDVMGSQLRSGTSQSCGCYSSDATVSRFTTHGGSRTPEYRVWITAKSRCYNPDNSKYRLYGGRRIKMCNRWRHDFSAFLADMGPRPEPRLTIERINSNGDYEPGNCRWASATDQNRNTSRNNFTTHEGETHTVAEWAQIVGMHYVTLYHRLHILNWPVDKALTTPVGPARNKRLTNQGESYA